MAHLGEAARRRGADALARAVGAYQVWEPPLDRVVAAAQRVIGGIGNLWRVLLMIEAGVGTHLPRKGVSLHRRRPPPGRPPRRGPPPFPSRCPPSPPPPHR